MLNRNTNPTNPYRASYPPQSDNSAKVMPLKEIMERYKVDHLLATGQVSDTELAFADEKAKQV